MPLIELFTNIHPESDKTDSGESDVGACPPLTPHMLVSAVATVLGKPSSYVMARISYSQQLALGDTNAPCALIRLESLGKVGGAANEAIVAALSSLVVEKLSDISLDRIYVRIGDVARSDWGYNGKTFAAV